MKTLSAIHIVIVALLGITTAGLLLLAAGGCDSGSNTTGPEPEPTTGPYTNRTATVTSIVDGDTIWVNGNEKVRYIGIDTPETGECYYTEAKERNRQLVGGRQVLMEICNASPTDQYGRTLAHIHVDNILVNAVLLQEGYARAYPVPPCTERADEYRNYMNAAFNSGAGMWSACF